MADYGFLCRAVTIRRLSRYQVDLLMVRMRGRNKSCSQLRLKWESNSVTEMTMLTTTWVGQLTKRSFGHFLPHLGSMSQLLRSHHRVSRRAQITMHIFQMVLASFFVLPERLSIFNVQTRIYIVWANLFTRFLTGLKARPAASSECHTLLLLQGLLNFLILFLAAFNAQACHQERSGGI